MSPLPRAAWLLLPILFLSCSDAGLYSIDGRGAGRKDRASFSGTVCVPLAGGEAFPTKVLFAMQGGQGIETEIVGYGTDALSTLSSRFSGPFVKFALVAHHSVATGLMGRFSDAAEFQAVLPQYASYQESGPISVRSALKLAKTLLSGDMQTSCRGEVARTRYVVVVVMRLSDASCANPLLNEGIAQRCRSLTSPTDCSSCELGAITGEIKDLARQYGAGEVVVQPIYVRGQTSDPITHANAAAIAEAGGTELLETDPAGLPGAITGLKYTARPNTLKLKRFIAYNRNVVVRAGQLLVDSDGDGLPDLDETALGTDPTSADSDMDGLMDGLEVRMGLDPLVPDVINGCSVSLDEDGDRLNGCEERVLGTDPCIGDTDGDTIPDLIEVLAMTNPLVPEDLLDSDRDGLTNIAEVEAHGDPLSADLDFHRERGYGYNLVETDPSVDGRICYATRVENISLMPTLARPHPFIPGEIIPAGTNDIYLYLQAGRDNDPRGAGIGSLLVQPVRYDEDKGRTPSGIIPLDPDAFILGT
ncbi:thrombospondin type 3 repeat-containing protein [Myxococcus sp. K15C18031901]|uniref:thrombospondin type 3 repeat-containing protein n=1 Tax=Myxococcus dinghuensis TaxID=2906761 RepID=UPI0020A76DDC|nr:thrombospondin type 3 repeat-containing protein [Myxococcus dinghuensis]MCP3105040.1 thrombospondin type 3 repeat-containing protein [Myxococcus dinghuensis]